MSKRKKRIRDSGDQRSTGEASERSSGGKRGPGGRGRKSWLQTHGRDLRFLAFFAFLMGLYYAASTTNYAQNVVFPSYLRLNARAAGALLGAVGYDITVTDQTIKERRFSVLIGRGCDAVQPSALFVSAVLASPVALSASVPAAIVGTVILMTINLIRIMTLLLTGIYTPKLFDIMHLEVWQALFIFLAILLWALWASWIARRRRAKARDAKS